MIDQSTSPSTNSPAPRSRLTGQRSPITLAFLFYLVTFGGIISACMRTLSDNAAATTESLQMVMGVCGGMGAAIGFFLGLLRFRRWSLAGLGIFSGAIVGSVAGALTLIGSQNFLEINLIASAGGWLMIVVMCFTARYKS